MTRSRARHGKQTNVAPAPAPSAVNEEADIPLSSESSRSVRASTRSRRPGVEAGLAPRNQADISAAAQKKREEKLAKDQAKQKEKNARSERELAGAKAVGRMLDKRARDEAERISQLDFIPSSDEEPLAKHAALAQPLGADAASDRRRPQSITQDKLRSPTGSDTQLQRNTREAHSPDDDHDTFTPTSPRHHEDSPSPTPSGSPMVLDDTPKFERAQPDLDRENRNPGGDGLGEPQYSKGDARRPQASQKSQGKHRECAPGESNAEVPKGVLPKPKKPTEAEKKKARVAQVRGEVDSARQVQPPVPAAASSKRTAETPARGNKTKKRKEEDAFTPDYRARIRHAAASASPSAQTPHRSDSLLQMTVDCGLDFLDTTPAASNSAAAPQSTDVAHALWDYAPFTFETQDSGSPALGAPLTVQQHEHTALSDEEIGGFGDDDVAVSRQAVVARKKPVKNMVAIVPNAMIEGDSVIPASTKKLRGPRTQVSATVSRAFFALDSWVQETVLTKIVPSLIDHYGSQENPWYLDGETRLEFGKKLNGLLTKLHPNRVPHDVKPGDKLWRFTRQQVYDWRSNFGKLAIKLAKAEVKQRADEHGRPYAAAWVANVLAKGGEATYSVPNIDEPSEARGALQTSYHIRLLTYHYEEADGSIIKTSYPIGALSLAVVAIRRAFRACLTGVYVPVKTEFSGDEVGQQTQLAREGAVAGLERAPHRFDSLVSVARSHVPSFMQAQALRLQETSDDVDAFTAVDPPSSPVFEN